MKPMTATRSVETFGLEKSVSFQINATAKAFEILSSGLYKDKITAILREISANAYDAHVDAGISDKAIKVHLPTILSPFLSIRDYGFGLPPRLMRKVYQTYFASLKELSDDFIGGLGLGSKSPFSYVDAYSVISRCGGRKITYDIFKNNNGEPQIAVRSVVRLLPEEGTGMEVIVPLVANSDVREFERKAMAVYELYPVVPEIHGSTLLPHKYNTVLEGNRWRVTDRSGSYFTEKARAIMGIIAYPISSSSLDTTEFANILRSPIDIEFNIGELDITAGREELSYNKPTKEALIARLKAIKQELVDEVNHKFVSCSNLAEAKALYGQLFGLNNPLASALGNNHVVDWGKKQISTSTFELEMIQFPGATVRYYHTSPRGNTRSIRSFGAYSDNKHLAIDCKHIDSFSVFYDDGNTKSVSARVFNYRSDTGKKVYLISAADDKQLGEFRKFFDGIEILPVSDLPKPTYTYDRASTKPRIKHLSSGYVGVAGPKHGPWYEKEVSVETGGIFVRTERGDITTSIDPRFGGGEYDFSKQYGLGRTLGFIKEEEGIYAIPLSQYSQFTTRKVKEKWIDFFVLVRQRAPSIFTPEVRAQIARGQARSRFNMPCNLFLDTVRMLSNKIGEDHAVTKFYDMFSTEEDDTWKQYVELAQICDIPLDEVEIDFNAEWNKIVESYPMLKLSFRDYMNEADTNIIFEYISMIDKDRK